MRVVGVATLVAAAVVACGLALQLVALPRAGHGDVVAARAATWLNRYRDAQGVVWIGRRRVRAACRRGWIDDARGRDRRGTLLTLGDGASIRDIPPHTLVSRDLPLRRPVALLQAAGCTRVLADRLAALAEFDGGVPARRTTLAGARVWGIDFPGLTVYVSRRTDRPVAVSNRWILGVFRLVPLAPLRETS